VIDGLQSLLNRTQMPTARATGGSPFSHPNRPEEQMEDDGFQTLTLQGSSTEGARRIEVAARAEGLSKISFGVLKAKAHELGPEGLQRTAEVLLGPQRAEGPASLGEELGHGTHHVSRFRFESLPNDRVQSILCHRGILLCAAG